MKLEELTKDERSLLLYIETCAVDYGGKEKFEENLAIAGLISAVLIFLGMIVYMILTY